MTEEESALAYRAIEALECIHRHLRGIQATLAADTQQNIVFDLDGEAVMVPRDELREWLKGRSS